MYLLDTNIFSLIINQNIKIIEQIQIIKEENTAISIITLGELYFMVENSKNKESNLILLNSCINSVTIFYIDKETTNIYGLIKTKILEKYAPKEKSKRKKVKITELGFDENDLWISAIALRNDLTVVSLDSDFERIKLVANIKLEKWET